MSDPILCCLAWLLAAVTEGRFLGIVRLGSFLIRMEKRYDYSGDAHHIASTFCGDHNCGVVIITVGMLVYLGKISLFSLTSITEDNIQELRRLCGEQPVPASFQRIRELESFKYTQGVFTIQFASSEDFENVDREITHKMLTEGFEYEDRSGGGQKRLAFFKDKYAVEVEHPITSFRPERNFFISCSWGVNNKELLGNLFH